MTPFISEFTGTSLLILLGNGVVANVLLTNTKGHGGGWIVITFGWAIAVFVGVYAATVSGAHLNPAITISVALTTGVWADVPLYITAQMLGAMLGTTMVWLAYKKHYDETDSADRIRATFCTAPAIRHTASNLITEIIGTFTFVMAVLLMSKPEMKLGPIDALPVALLVLGIGLSLGGPTGYAINPARDLAPRIMHFILPIKHKGDSQWSYSWIPVAGPIIGAVLASYLFKFLGT